MSILVNYAECFVCQISNTIKPTFGFKSIKTIMSHSKCFEVMRMFIKGQFDHFVDGQFDENIDGKHITKLGL